MKSQNSPQNPTATANASSAETPAIPASLPQNFRYYDLVMAAFVAILLLSNIIGASKRSVVDIPFLGETVFGAGVLFFPISYIIGDMLTEVYGYARARRVIWTGFAALLFMAFMAWVVVALPPAAGWNDQAAYSAVFGNSWRIVAASMLAFWAGEFANSMVLAKMKLAHKNAGSTSKGMGWRFVISTIIGQGLDSLIFYPIAFYGLESWPTDQLLRTVLSQWAIKTGWEIILLPITILIVAAIKRREGVEIYDDQTSFNPFAVKL
jgi:hypothetical protein